MNNMKKLHLDICETMMNLDPASEEYSMAVNNLKTLEEARTTASKRRITPEIVLNTVAFFGGIVSILFFEKSDVISTKAFSLIPKIHL